MIGGMLKTVLMMVDGISDCHVSSGSNSSESSITDGILF